MARKPKEPRAGAPRPPREAPRGPHRGRTPFALAVLVLVALTAAVYAPTLSYGFVDLDDPFFTTGRVPDGLTGENVRWAFSGLYAGFYAPLTLLSHILDFQLYGSWAGGHHLTNLLLHLAATLLLLAALTRATRSPWRSFCAAALFALHPLHVESVAWVAERKDVLSTALALAALLAYVLWTERPSPARYLPVAALFALALLAKSMVVTLPLLLLLLDYWPLGRLGDAGAPGRWGIDPKRLLGRLAEKAPLLALSFLSAWLTLSAQGEAGALSVADRLSFEDRAANAVLSYGRYLLDTVWPARLAVYYPHPQSAYSGALVALGLLFLASVTACALLWARRRPWFAVGWFWYLVSLVPVIGLVQVGLQSSADRYTYLPLVGVFVMAAWGGGALLETRRAGPRAWAAAGLAALLLVTAFAARRQVETWRTSETLYRHALRHYPQNPTILTNLGSLLGKERRYAEAAECFAAAGRLTRELPAEARLNWAMALSQLGRHQEAADLSAGVLSRDPRSGRAHYLLAFSLSQLQRHGEALPHYREAYAQGGVSGEQLLRIGEVYRRGGLLAEAAAVYRLVAPADAAYGRAQEALRTGAPPKGP